MSVHGHGSNDQLAYLQYDSREKARRDSPEYLRYRAADHAAETLAAKKPAAEANARAAEAEARAAEYKAQRVAAEARAAALEAQIAALAAKLTRVARQMAPDGSSDR